MCIALLRDFYIMTLGLPIFKMCIIGKNVQTKEEQLTDLVLLVLESAVYVRKLKSFELGNISKMLLNKKLVRKLFKFILYYHFSQFPCLVEEVPVRTKHIWFNLQLPH